MSGIGLSSTPPDRISADALSRKPIILQVQISTNAGYSIHCILKNNLEGSQNEDLHHCSMQRPFAEVMFAFMHFVLLAKQPADPKAHQLCIQARLKDHRKNEHDLSPHKRCRGRSVAQYGSPGTNTQPGTSQTRRGGEWGPSLRCPQQIVLSTSLLWKTKQKRVPPPYQTKAPRALRAWSRDTRVACLAAAGIHCCFLREA